MRKSNVLSEGVKCLEDLGIEFALCHEAAITAFGLNYSAFFSSIDAVIRKEDFDKLVSKLDLFPEARMFELEFADDLVVRLWSDAQLFGKDVTNHKIWVETYQCYALDPELVLKMLPESPDSALLLEQRARLAEVLYCDKMSDEELLAFHRYVRGD